ncbi:MAG: hypothetical protein EXR29_10570 [Betaproteobacteria bacterium]|nr:hypothetical protein [Betaproteobacteria bacterium]
MKRSLILSSIFVLMAAIGSASASAFAAAKREPIPEVPPTQSMPSPADLRDFRYCEVIPVFKHLLALKVEVYNTIGQNDCPAEPWAKLDANAMKKQYGAVAVKLNGPRHWVLNRIEGGGATAAGKIVNFGGIQMKQVAVIETKVWQATVGDKFYQENKVHRTTTFFYQKNNRLYELVSAKGAVYMMQSYAQIADAKLTLAALETLGASLKLPKGWSYRTRVLTDDVELKAQGLAYVINDNLYNSYQKVLP